MNYKKILLILLVPAALLAAATGTFIYANKVIGIYSQQNFAVDGDFEKSTYAVSLSGGGSTAVAIASGGGIFGNALSITTPQNNDEVRIGINTTTGLGGLNCEARFNLKLVSTNTSPTIVDVDVISNAGTLSISNTQRVTLSANNVWVPVSVNFPCSRPVAATFGRIKIIDAGVASSGTPIVYTDSFYAGEATNITNQVVVTDWQDFPSVAAGTLITATTTNPTYGTVVTNKAQYRYVGSDVEIRWQYKQSSAGTAGSGQYLFNIPSSICAIDTAKVLADSGTTVNDATSSNIGSLAYTLDGGTDYTGIYNASVYSSSQIKFGGIEVPEGRYSWGSVGGNFGFTGSATYSINAKVPCVGRSATQSAITQQCIQDGSCENTFTAKVSNVGAISNQNISGWLTSCSGSSPYNCTFKAGLFGGITPVCLAHSVDGGVYSSESFLSLSATGFSLQKVSNGAGAFTLVCYRGAGDYKPRFAAPVLVGSVTSNASGALRIEYIKATCASGGSSIQELSTAGWATSITTLSSGYCDVAINGFSSTPRCFGSTEEDGNTSTIVRAYATSPTNLRFRCWSGGACTTGSAGFVAHCIGPR